jgi:hypothetical protein
MMAGLFLRSAYLIISQAMDERRLSVVEAGREFNADA